MIYKLRCWWRRFWAPPIERVSDRWLQDHAYDRDGDRLQ